MLCKLTYVYALALYTRTRCIHVHSQVYIYQLFNFKSNETMPLYWAATWGTGGHFYRYGYGCSVRVLGTGTGVGYGCWVQVLGTGTGVGYCWVRLRELVLGILLLGAGTGVGYMFGCRHRTHVPYPCTVPMYRATVPMYGIHLPYHRTHRTHEPYPPYPPYVSIRTQLAADLASDFFDIFEVY